MATCTITNIEGIELQALPVPPIIHPPSDISSRTLGTSDIEDIRGNGTPPDTAVDVRQKWNSPRINKYRVLATFWSFFVFGMNDGSYGALLPFLEKYYHLSYTVVSLIFLSPFAGCTLASLLNNHVHVHFGQRGVSIIGSICHIIPYWVLALHPPYPVLVVVFMFVGFANGLLSAAWAAWVGNMVDANQVTGVLQACYSLGAVISPLMATALVNNAGLGWYSFYFIMIGASALELAVLTTTFWSQTGAVYVTENPRPPNAKSGRTREALSNKLTWIIALFIFGYVGAEVSLGGWIITFMTHIRSAPSIAAAGSSTGFWAGMTLGRLCLSFLTARIGEFTAVILYLVLSIILELLFWLVPSFLVSAISVALLGLFLGPIFPTAIVMVTKLLPKSLHVGCIGFASAFGGSGGAVFPFVVGVVAQKRGVRSLQPVILGLLVGIAGLWFVMPRKGMKEHREREEGDLTSAE